MAEEAIGIIPKSEYLDELEEEVKFFMTTTPDLPYNEDLFEYVKEPEHKNEAAQREWEILQIKRCKDGYKSMCGKQYFYFNFCKIEDLRGKIRPEYRVCDNEWYKQIEWCTKSEEWGLICVKRRRVGASWKEAADVLHDCLFNKYFHIGMNSKSERDSISLFRKVKFLYNNLPAFLRVKTTASNTKMFLDFSYFSKDTNGNKIKKGNGSTITVVSPTDSAYEGMMLNKWIADEAGKVSNLDRIWSYTEDCLMRQTKRVGVPIIFGTSGDVGNVGKALKDMWYNSDIYKLKKFFFAGWNGLIVDDKGNDLKEEGIRWIIYERYRRRKTNPVEYNDFVQKYPLTAAEAFSQASTGGIGDMVKINAQKISLYENPPKKTTGFFRFNAADEVEFVPDVNGKVIVYEHPVKNLKAGYIAGIDPADHDNAYDEASDLSMYILKKQNGLDSPKIVCEYTDRPKKLNDYYDQSIMALLYYNKAKALIERNRFRIISYYEDMGYKYLLTPTPQGIVRLVGGRVNTIGINMNETTKEYMVGLISEYVDNYCEFIPSVELLQEFIDFGTKNTDKAMAFGICLILLKEDKTNVQKRDTINTTVPRFSYRRVNGKIMRVKE